MAIGCGSLFLLMVVAVVGFGWWLVRERPILDMQRMVGADNRSFFIFQFDPQDPGTRAMLIRAIEVSNRKGGGRQREDLRKNDGQMLKTWFPRINIAILPHYPPVDPALTRSNTLPQAVDTKVEGDTPVFVFSVSKWTGLAQLGYRLFVNGAPSKTQSRYGHHAVTKIEGPGTWSGFWARSDNHFVHSDDDTSLKKALDRLPGSDFAPATPLTAEILGRLDRTRAVVAIVDNTGNELAGFLAALGNKDGPAPMSRSQVESLSQQVYLAGATVHPMSEDTLAVRLILVARNAEAAQGLQAFLKDMIEVMETQGKIQKGSGKVASETVKGKTWPSTYTCVNLDLTLIGLGQYIERSMKN